MRCVSAMMSVRSSTQSTNRVPPAGPIKLLAYTVPHIPGLPGSVAHAGLCKNNVRRRSAGVQVLCGGTHHHEKRRDPQGEPTSNHV